MGHGMSQTQRWVFLLLSNNYNTHFTIILVGMWTENHAYEKIDDIVGKSFENYTRKSNNCVNQLIINAARAISFSIMKGDFRPLF